MKIMTSDSEKYFEEVAGEWDAIRAGYFIEALRDAAIARAYLRSEMVVADIGGGSGFVSAGLAPLVSQVHLVDGSAAMINVARRNLSQFNNVVYHEADGASIPLPDGSVDAVFANMYLHHCTDPLVAIQEMTRILKPGGRLVITDMDEHSYTWMKEEMADVWMGFNRAQVYQWFKQAGLVNVIVDCSGQSCCSETKQPEKVDPNNRQAQISIFVAIGTHLTQMREEVRRRYGATAAQGGSCCGDSANTNSSCCSGDLPLIQYNKLEQVTFDADYSHADLLAAPQEAAEMSLGCGNPTAQAGLKAGEVVLDIGSGAGLDAFLAAQKVGLTGRVIGVDMTPEMLEKSRQHAMKSGLKNVEFRQGQAEELPVADLSVDVIISNCVINLCEDKGKVFAESYRVLKVGGRLEVSDMVTDRSLPAKIYSNASEWSECVAGALPEQEYLDLIAQAGFKDIRCQRSRSSGVVEGINVYSVSVSAYKKQSCCS